MEPIAIPFETFGIDKCRNETCDQLYNEDSIKLAVWLYGVVFLHEEKTCENTDPLFGPSKHEIMLWYEKTKGYIGITCPKCLKTNFYEMSARKVKEFENFLNSWSIPNKNDQDNKKQSLSWMPEFISVNLKYYSPFRGTNTILKDFCIHAYAYDRQGDGLDFFDDLGMSFLEEEKDLQDSFCSYNMTNRSEPTGTYIIIYWFDEERITEITNYENEKREKLFPRYHYFHALMEKIDSLLKYNYYTGRQIDQELIDTEESMKVDLKNYELHYLRKEDIGKRKKQIEIDFEKSGKFFGILISDPIELNPFMREPFKNCDYLWIMKDPFSGKGMPEDFSFGNQPDEATKLSSDIRNNHKKMVDLIQKNFHKQYVQEFLKDNLIDFLEEYEGLIQSNPFSYAAVWELKESYLEGLYTATNKGLSSESPYVMKREMDAWIMVFNNIKSEKLLRGIGFAYIYYLLCNENEYYYHSELLPESGKMPKTNKNKETHDETTGGIEAEPMTTNEDIKNRLDAIKECKNDLEDAARRDEQEEVERLEKRKTLLFKELYEVYNPKTKKIRYFQHKNTKNAVDSVGKAIQRALEQLEKKNPKAHRHLFKALDGDHLFQETLSYRPAPDEKIDWILA